MVVKDFHVKRVPVPPHETYAVLIVDPPAVLSGAIPAQRLQLITRRHPQVVERNGGIENRQFLKRSSLKIGRESPGLAGLPQPFRVLVSESGDHSRIILTRCDTIVKQQYSCTGSLQA
jgi:hypothetical protein